MLLPVDQLTEGVSWLPSGKGIVFSSMHDSHQVIYWTNLDGTDFRMIGDDRHCETTNNMSSDRQCDWFAPTVSPDNKQLVVIERGGQASERTLIAGPGSGASFTSNVESMSPRLGQSSVTYHTPYVVLIDLESRREMRIVRGTALSVVWRSQ